MQQLLFQQTDTGQCQSQPGGVLPGHGTGVHGQAANDDVFDDRKSLFRLVMSVLGNVIGGSLLLCVLFLLPQIVAQILA